MLRIFASLLLALLPFVAQAQKSARPLDLPLQFVRAAEVLVLDQSADNFVLKALSVDPYLHPDTVTLTPREVRRFGQLYRRGALLRGPHLPTAADSLARLLLVSGDARYALALDSLKREALAAVSLDAVRTPAARLLLNSLGWMAATDARGVYINLLDDCLINVATPQFRFTIDQIREGDHYKYRISGLPAGNFPLTIRLRLPNGPAPTYYLNGRRLLRPQVERGYLVVEREWRNGDEIFYQ